MSTLKSLASADFRLLIGLAADVVDAQLADELRPCKLRELSLKFELFNQSLKLILYFLRSQRIGEIKTSAVTVDRTVYCITVIVLEHLIAPQQHKESTVSNKNYVKHYFTSEI